MLAEVISFGGRWKNFSAIIQERHRLANLNPKGEKQVRVRAESDEKTVLVKIQIKQRDNRKTVKIDNPGKPDHGKEVENERYGKFYYETYDSIELEQATGQEVKEACLRGIAAASKK